MWPDLKKPTTSPKNCVNWVISTVPLECAILGQLNGGIGAAISSSIAKLQDTFHLPQCSEIDAFFCWALIARRVLQQFCKLSWSCNCSDTPTNSQARHSLKTSVVVSSNSTVFLREKTCVYTSLLCLETECSSQQKFSVLIHWPSLS